jgi:glycosyltransferase involved in cell wall biosynthesis
MIKAALFTPGLAIGGAERWAATLVACSDPARICWTGVAINAFSGRDPAMCREVAAVTSIYAPPVMRAYRDKLTAAGESPDCSQYIQECPDLRTAVEQACAGADVLIGWGPYFCDPAIRTARTPQYRVHVSHTSEPAAQPVAGPYRVYRVAVSEAARNGFGVQAANAHVIYNGVDLRRLQPQEGREAIRRRWGVRAEQRVLGFIGRQATVKNAAAAVQAMTRLDPRIWRCVYYGSTPTGQRACDAPLLAAALRGETPDVQCFTHTDSIADVYAGLDVVMLASDAEACSLVLLESWLTHTPVVATLVGCLPELQAKHGPLCMAVPKRAPAAVLAAAVEQAVAAEHLETITRAYTLAAQTLTATAMVTRWADYLERLLAPSLVRLAL